MKHKTALIQLNIFILFFLVFAFHFSTSAQSKVYTLDEAINTALNNNRDITISEMNVKKAVAAIDQAYGYALPSLDLSGSFSHFLEKPKMSFPDFGSLLQNATYSILFDENVLPRDESKFKPLQNVLQSFAQTNNYSTSLTLSQTIFSSAVFKGIGASQIYYDLAKADLNGTVSKTVLSVQKTFYGVLLSKEVLDITKQSFENAEANLNDVEALYREGMVSEFDMLQAQVQVENIRPAVLQMENNLQSAKDGLKIILGIEQNDEIDVAGEFVYTPYDISNEEELINEALVSNFEIKTLELKKQVDEAFVELDVSELLA
jgi:outer membrane protein